MQNLKNIKNRITSIGGTIKVTKAMQLISSVKASKVIAKYESSKLYLEALLDILSELALYKSDIDHLFITKKDENKKALIVLFGTERGFVGPMISSLGTKLKELTLELENKKTEYEIITIRKKALFIANRFGFDSKYHFDKSFEDDHLDEISAIKSLITDSFSKDGFDSVYFVYTNFITRLNIHATSEKVLPIQLKEVKKEISEFKFQIEPDIESVISNLMETYLDVYIYNTFLNTASAEHLTRMIEMKKATDNAEEIKDNLQVEFNKTRQGVITTQIQENINANLV